MTVSSPPRFAFSTLFAVVFIDLVGFGIVIPLVPFYAERLGARPELITLIIALHSLFQMLATPLWGAVSDKRGRRPVLLVSVAGHAASYLLMGFSNSLWLLALARVMSGVTSANIATAYAYIADITGPEERVAAMGKISAAFGLGFAVGPAIGGLLAGGTSMAEANLFLPAAAAAAFSAAAFVAIYFFLPETLPPGTPRPVHELRPRLTTEIALVAKRPVITMMLALGLLVITFMAARESIFPLWLHYQMGFSARQLGIVLGFSGGLISVIQFGGMSRFNKRFGELALVKTACVLFAGSWLAMTQVHGMVPLLAVIAFQCFGSAFFQTCMQSLLSQRAGISERGLVLGVYQSSTAFARFIGQASSGTMFGQLGMNAPFYIGAAAMGPALWLAVLVGRRMLAAPPMSDGQSG